MVGLIVYSATELVGLILRAKRNWVAVNKIFIRAFCLLVLLVSKAVGIESLEQGSSLSSKAGQIHEESNASKSHPDFFDQWLRMKGATNAPQRAMYSEWIAHDQKMRRTKPDAPSLFAHVEYLGPADVGGRTRALLIDRCNGNRVFAGAVSGGLWRSDDRGASWIAIDDAGVSLAVSGITQSPFDHKLIYYCTGEARANTAGILGNGVFRSADGGMSFHQLPSTIDSRFDRCWCITHSRSNRSTFYVGTEDAGLLRTDDEGNSWRVVLAATPVTDVICMPSGEVFASVSSCGIYRSNSGDAGTFNLTTNDAFPSAFQRIEIEECASQPNVIYAAFEAERGQVGASGFCVSHDGGVSWTPQRPPPTEEIYNRYCFVLGVHPCDPSLVFCSGRLPAFSRDGGVNWGRANNSHSDYHALATFPDNTDYFLVGNDGGVYQYRWSNPRVAAIDMNHGYHVTQFYAGDYAPSGDLVIGGTQDNGTFKIDSATRVEVHGGDGTHCHISRQNPNLAYGSSQWGKMSRSWNFLAPNPTWSSINKIDIMDNEGYQFVNSFQMNQSDDRQLFCRTNEAIWRTTDYGESWSRLSTGIVADLFAITCSNHPDPTVYYGGSNANLFRVDNAATATLGTEHDLSLSVPASVTNDFIGAIAVHPEQIGTILVGFVNFDHSPRLWKVRGADTGSPVWSSVSNGLPRELPVNSVQMDPLAPEHSFIAATDFGLYFTTDGGTHWFKERRIPNVSIHQIKLRTLDRVLFAFTHGRGVWKLELERN